MVRISFDDKDWFDSNKLPQPEPHGTHHGKLANKDKAGIPLLPFNHLGSCRGPNQSSRQTPRARWNGIPSITVFIINTETKLCHKQ